MAKKQSTIAVKIVDQELGKPRSLETFWIVVILVSTLLLFWTIYLADLTPSIKLTLENARLNTQVSQLSGVITKLGSTNAKLENKNQELTRDRDSLESWLHNESGLETALEHELDEYKSANCQSSIGFIDSGTIILGHK